MPFRSGRRENTVEEGALYKSFPTTISVLPQVTSCFSIYWSVVCVISLCCQVAMVGRANCRNTTFLGGSHPHFFDEAETQCWCAYPGSLHIDPQMIWRWSHMAALHRIAYFAITQNGISRLLVSPVLGKERTSWISTP